MFCKPLACAFHEKPVKPLNRGRFYLRTCQGLNYHQFDFEKLKKVKEERSIPLAAFNGMAGDSSADLAK